MRKWLVGLTAAFLLIPAASAVAAAGPLPVIYNGAFGFAHASPTASPPVRTTGLASRRRRIRDR
jgi:hypothetical protein